MRKIIGKAAYLLSVFFQIALITAVFVINDLTRKKAGVNHHVYYKRHQYEQSIYSIDSLVWQSIIAALIGLLFLLFLVFALKKSKSRFYQLQIALTAIISFAVCFVINSDFFNNMLAYPYFIMVFQIILVIQIIIVTILSLKNK